MTYVISKLSPSIFSDNQIDDEAVVADIVQSDHDDLNLEAIVTTWQDNPTDMKTFNYETNNQLLVPAPENGEPFDYWRLLVDDDFLQRIVDETNIYAEEIFLAHGAAERSRISAWKELTVDEFLTFLGLTFHTGTIRCNRIQDYWKTHRLFNLKCFSSHMSRDRYLLILRALHFSRNPGVGEPEPEDRLYKIRPVVSYFNKKMSDVYCPGKNLSLDESMVLWRGRLLFRQYIKNKRHKYGIKMYMLTEPNGFILKSAIYTGQLDTMGGKGHADKVVLHLMEERLNLGHSLFMDNYYNSVQLAKKLLDFGTYCTGTLRGDRKGSPKDVVTAKLNPGESKGKYMNGVLVGKWKDKRDVTYISTEYTNDMIGTENRRGHVKEKPKPIVQYNTNMSGIDRQDQMMSYYPCSRKTMRWYKKLAIHFFQLLLLNSHYLYNTFSGKRLNLYDFRLAVIEKLLPEKEHTAEDKKHYPTKVEGKNKSGKTMRKKCKVCYQNKIRRDTVYCCNSCPEKPGLCIDGCFEKFHKNLL